MFRLLVSLQGTRFPRSWDPLQIRSSRTNHLALRRAYRREIRVWVLTWPSLSLQGKWLPLWWDPHADPLAAAETLIGSDRHKQRRKLAPGEGVSLDAFFSAGGALPRVVGELGIVVNELLERYEGSGVDLTVDIALDSICRRFDGCIQRFDTHGEK